MRTIKMTSLYEMAGSTDLVSELVEATLVEAVLTLRRLRGGAGAAIHLPLSPEIELCLYAQDNGEYWMELKNHEASRKAGAVISAAVAEEAVALAFGDQDIRAGLSSHALEWHETTW